MEARIRKWGNSLGIRIPGLLAKELDLQEGSPIEIEKKENHIIIRPGKEKRLSDLIDEITPENTHEETESTGPVGREVW